MQLYNNVTKGLLAVIGQSMMHQCSVGSEKMPCTAVVALAVGAYIKSYYMHPVPFRLFKRLSFGHVSLSMRYVFHIFKGNQHTNSQPLSIIVALGRCIMNLAFKRAA